MRDALPHASFVGFTGTPIELAHANTRAVLAKTTPGESKTDEELNLAIRQIISRAVVSDEVVDIFAAAGLQNPDLSILSDAFLADIRGMPQRNLAVELRKRSRRGVLDGSVDR
jgi:type I restriction enzyme R subunit